MRIPPFLRAGDEIALIASSGFIAPADCTACVESLFQCQFRVKMGSTIGSQYKSFYTFSGTDQQRLFELQQALDTPTTQAILFARGGYGLIRIMDQIDFTQFVKYPKWIIGFSDLTLLHHHILKNYGICTLHSPMAKAFSISPAVDANQLIQILKGNKDKIDFRPSPWNQAGTAMGVLLGGNLTTLCTTMGSSSELDLEQSILVIEDINEPFYAVDRMIQQLKRANKLSNLRGLIVGSFVGKQDDEHKNKIYHQIIRDALVSYTYPVCFTSTIGHGPRNEPFVLGATYELKLDSKTATLSPCY